MQNYLSSLYCGLLILCCTTTAMAQSGKVTLKGTVLEKESQQPVPFATVAVKDVNTGKPLVGMTTQADGRFQLVTASKSYYVEVSFIGFATTRIDDFDRAGTSIDLGDIFLEEDKQVLEEVVVSGERSRTTFQVDKRVFNVGDDLSSSGMGAMEVLNNVPSVNVSIEGEVSLRGSAGVQILIDGKPSILADDPANALGAITADMIESVEVITNPSAKYDAEGTAGILNIILKKEEKRGVNGSVTVNTGIPDNHSIGVSLTKRTEKLNLFTQFGAGFRSLPRFIENVNEDFVNNTVLESDGEFFRDEQFYNLTLGADYYFDPKNVLTLSGNFAYEIEEQPSATNFQLFDNNNTLIRQWERREETDATNPKWQYELNYKREFKDNEDHTLIFSGLGQFFGKDQDSEFANTVIVGDNVFGNQETRTEFQQTDYTFKIDYTNPLTEKVTLETGAQYVINDVGNDFAVVDLVDGVRVPDESLTNNFEFEQSVLGVYSTGAFEGKQWGVKVGLRVEHTQLNTFLVNTNQENEQDYTSLFPSAHASYKFSETFSTQVGYSRRVYRPRLWDLNPFF